MNAFNRWFPAAVVLACAGYLAPQMFKPAIPGSRFQFDQFARLPVVDDGRVKPFESMARETLLQLSGKQTWTNSMMQERSAVEWLLSVMGRTPEAGSARVFRIDHPQLLDMLGLEQRLEPVAWRNRYALEEFQDKIPPLIQQAMKIQEGGKDADERAIVKLAGHLQLWLGLMQGASPLAVPPAADGGDWTSLSASVNEMQVTGSLTPAAQSLAMILSSYKAANVEGFNRGVGLYQQMLQKQLPTDTFKSDLETWFRNFSPFYHGTVLYGIALVLALIALLLISTPLAAPFRNAATGVLILTLAVHTISLIIRMYLQGRPPVTNLYASAIFIGWGAVILGLALEWIYRVGIGAMVASVIGIATLIVAHNLAKDGSDTMEMQRAVLDTNFWLATHVTTITLGYMAAYVAGFLAVLYILAGTLTGWLTAERRGQISAMIYGVVCFATFLSFTGTVLGGIWADQSWGRFWGWDPKENGALLLVIWTALILHARWGGMAKQRGIACLAVFGNIVTSWSWFGVNELGVGLHSYGFTEGTKFVLVCFVASQLLIIGLGLLPMQYWRSFRADVPQDKSRPVGRPAAA